MALSRLKTWIDEEILTHTDLNAEFDNILNNATSLLTPFTASLDMNGFDLILDADGDTKIVNGVDDTWNLQVGGGTRLTLNATTAIFDANVDLNENQLQFDDDNDSYFYSPGDDIVHMVIGGGVDFIVQTNEFQVQSGSKIAFSDAADILDLNGAGLVIDADGDLIIKETSDDIIGISMQGVELFRFEGDVASPTNGVRLVATATSGDPAVEAIGTDTDINLKLIGKGTGQPIIGSDYIDHFPTGLPLFVAQATAPTGWTIDTTHNDKALRLVSSGHTSTANDAFTTVFGASINTGGTALTVSQLPAHTHGQRGDTASGVRDYHEGGGATSTVAIQEFSALNSGNGQIDTSSTGSGSTHNHSMTMNLSYVDVIIITKDA